jgi:hypothetical protein
MPGQRKSIEPMAERLGLPLCTGQNRGALGGEDVEAGLGRPG